MELSVSNVTANIQLALAPVFLLTAIATLLSAITARLARNVDRMRFVQNEIYGGSSISVDLRTHYLAELKEFKMRGRLCTAGIFFDVLSGFFISCTILELFFVQSGAAESVRSGFAVGTFVLGIMAFMAAMVMILIEVIVAYRSASWDVPQDRT